MALQQSVGTAFAVSATLPDTNTLTDFDGLSFIEVGRLSEVPDLTGEFDIANFDDLTTGEEVKFSDVNREGDGDIKLGLDLELAGQVVLETAAETGASVSLRFTLKNGTIYYRKGIVKSFKPSDISTGNVVMATVMVAFFGKSLKKAG